MGVKLVSASGGSVEINPPATASSFTATMPAGTGNVVVAGINSAIVSGTSQASTSGTSIDFTGIPSWVKRITVMFSGVSTSGTSNIQVQLGDSGGIEVTGYAGSYGGNSGTSIGGAAYAGAGFVVTNAVTAASNIQGQLILSLIGSNAWVGTGNTARADSYSSWTAGAKTLSDTLTQVRITTVNGTDTFDAGSINILYE
jgi:hypothetical protein